MTRSTLPTRIAIGVAAGAVLAVGIPLAASAHVEVDPTSAPGGDTTPLTFAFHHGCDDSPTRSLTITIPDGVGNATPVYQGGWSIRRTLGADKTPTSITFTADSPIPTGVAASVSLEALFDSSAQGKTIAFPVEQKCVKGSTSWSQVPADGQTTDDLDNPAPAVAVTDAATPTPATTTPAASASSPDPVARWLAGGGLVAGVAALVVAVVSLVRRRR